MKQIDQILKRISVLFYIFVGLFTFGTIYGFVSGILIGIEKAKTPPPAQPMFETILMSMLSLLYFIAFIWSLVLFAKLLISIWQSISQKNIFSYRTTKLITRYAKVYLAVIILTSINILLSDIVSNPESTIMLNSSMLSELSSLVMLLMFGQILKIGCILKEEQELTI